MKIKHIPVIKVYYYSLFIIPNVGSVVKIFFSAFGDFFTHLFTGRMKILL